MTINFSHTVKTKRIDRKCLYNNICNFKEKTAYLEALKSPLKGVERP